MTHENDNITMIDPIMALVYKLDCDPVTYEEALSELTSWFHKRSNGVGLSGRTRIRAANLLEEMIHEFQGNRATA